MAVDLAGVLNRLVAKVETQTFPGAADRMAETLRDGASSAMGGDLTFSGGAGSVRIDGVAEQGRAAVTVGGAYGLADKGRRSAVSAVGVGGSPLRTPYGPRQSVRGSTWGGFGITARYGREALRAGVTAAIAEVKWGRGG